MNLRLLLALSLALNAGLGLLLILQTASQPPPYAGPPAREPLLTNTSNPAAETAAETEPAPDYRRLFAALRATGLPREEIENILRGAALSDWQDDLRATGREFYAAPANPADLRESIELRRARETALADVTEKEEFLVLPGWLIGPDAWDAIPPEKRKAVILLEEDYQLLLASANGNEAIQLLEEERLQDLATVLNETELADYELAAAPDFAPVPTVQSPETDLPISAPPSASRVDDPVFQELSELTERFGLSPERAAEVYELRRVVLEQQQELAADPDLSPEEREGALQLLTGDARDVVREILGEDGFAAYSETDGDWLDGSAESAPGPETENP